jgi:hypothetical protein
MLHAVRANSRRGFRSDFIRHLQELDETDRRREEAHPPSTEEHRWSWSRDASSPRSDEPIDRLFDIRHLESDVVAGAASFKKTSNDGARDDFKDPPGMPANESQACCCSSQMGSETLVTPTCRPSQSTTSLIDWAAIP